MWFEKFCKPTQSKLLNALYERLGDKGMRGLEWCLLDWDADPWSVTFQYVPEGDPHDFKTPRLLVTVFLERVYDYESHCQSIEVRIGANTFYFPMREYITDTKGDYPQDAGQKIAERIKEEFERHYGGDEHVTEARIAQ